MKKLRFLLEYHCYPIWIYDENGVILDTLLPDDLKDDKELDVLFTEIQKIFDSLYTDTPTEFSYRDFETEADRRYFISLMHKATGLLAERAQGRYILDFSYLNR